MNITQELFKLQDIEYIDFTAKLNPTVDPETYTSRYGIRILAGRLERWTHNKTIQKAMESLYITVEQKEYLKSLKK